MSDLVKRLRRLEGGLSHTTMSGEIEVIDATIGEIKRLEQLAFKHMAEDANRRQRIEELEKMLAERNHNIDLTCVAPVYGLNACGYRTLHDGGRWGCKYESLCEYQTPKRPVVCWNPNDTKFKINPLPAEQDYDAEKREEINGDRKEAEQPEKEHLDGTDKLCFAIYGRGPMTHDYLGGANAQMLYDGAKLISDLHARLAAVEKERDELKARLTKYEGGGK